MDGKDNPVVKSPHGNAVQVPAVNAVKSSKGTREEYIHNIQELKMEVAKSKPNKTHMKRLLQVNEHIWIIKFNYLDNEGFIGIC